MTFVEGIGYLSAAIGIAMFAMQTIPLRAAAIAHNLRQIAFGLLAGSLPTVVRHAVLLPLNGYRLSSTDASGRATVTEGADQAPFGARANRR